jgi:glycosyltransferase involved in cell wall biosynthesis
MPAISIITPVYNASAYLHETITSVLAQTVTDWEWILVDDGSKDGSLRICQGTTQDPRIRLLQHPGGANHGQAASRNLAIRHATGPLLAFLDADDVWVPEKLERDLATFGAFPRAALIYCGMLLWKSWNSSGGKDYSVAHCAPTDQLLEPPQLLNSIIRDLYNYDSQFPAPSCVVVRRDAQPIGEEFFEPGLSDYEEIALLTRVLLRHPAVVCSDLRVYHRRGMPSFSSEISADQHDASWNQIIQWVEAYVTASRATAADAVMGAVRQAHTALKRERKRRRRRVALEHVMAGARILLPRATREWLWEKIGLRWWTAP